MQSEIASAEKRLNELILCISELEEEIRLCDENAVNVLDSASETINNKRLQIESMIDEMRDDLTASHQCDVILTLKYKEDAITTTISTLEQAEDVRTRNELQELRTHFKKYKTEQYKKKEEAFLLEHNNIMKKTMEDSEASNKKTLGGLLKMHQIKLKELLDSK